MKRNGWATLVAVGLAAASPSLARAVQPEAAGHVTGMSELPGPVQDAVAREARHTGSEIGELRVEPHGLFLSLIHI